MKKTLCLLCLLIFVACSGTYQQPSLYEKDANKMLERANKALLQGDYPKSMSYLDDAILMANANNLPNIKIKALLQKAQLMLSVGMKNDAQYFIKEAKEVSQKEVIDYLPYVNYSEALYLWEIGKPQEAKNTIKDFEKIPKDLEPSYYNLLALLEISSDNISKGMEYIEKAEKSAIREENFEQQSYANKLKAHLAFKSHNYKDAIDFGKKALSIDRKTGNREAILWDVELLGTAYKEAGDKDSAFYYYYQGYELSVATNNRKKRDFFLEQASGVLK